MALLSKVSRLWSKPTLAGAAALSVTGVFAELVACTLVALGVASAHAGPASVITVSAIRVRPINPETCFEFVISTFSFWLAEQPQPY